MAHHYNMPMNILYHPLYYHPSHANYPQHQYSYPAYPHPLPGYSYFPPPRPSQPPPAVHPATGVMIQYGCFKPSHTLDPCENYDDYEPGGLHPICIGDEFFGGRYKILHKFGFGDSSTVWLARDRQQYPGKLVALKALRADESSLPLSEMPDLTIPHFLRSALPPDVPSFMQAVDHHFFVHGPNGSHLFLVSPFAGPSIRSVTELTVRVRKLRPNFARRIAKQIAHAVFLLHRAGIVHGDICTANIILRPVSQALWWSDTEVYAELCQPVTESIDDPDPHVPAHLVEPASCQGLVRNAQLDGSIVIIDFGQSYNTSSLPANYKPGAHPPYAAPEIHFEDRAGMEADIWALACVLFELRAGYSPVSHYSESLLETIEATVYMLGRMPDPWWQQYEDKEECFEEDGTAKLDPQRVMPIRAKLRKIGTTPSRPTSEDDGPLCEPLEEKLSEEEIMLLGDLLERMLRYRPEERIRVEDVVKHPWFEFTS